jgi:hypothetical protein
MFSFADERIVIHKLARRAARETRAQAQKLRLAERSFCRKSLQ